jgi:hypothetical protein
MWMMMHLYIQIQVPVWACASTRTDPNTRPGISITSNGNFVHFDTNIYVYEYTNCVPPSPRALVSELQEKARFLKVGECEVSEILKK